MPHARTAVGPGPVCHHAPGVARPAAVARGSGGLVIFIVVKFHVKPEWVDRWIELTTPFTEATRAEPGNLWFDWSRSIDHPDEARPR